MGYFIGVKIVKMLACGYYYILPKYLILIPKYLILIPKISHSYPKIIPFLSQNIPRNSVGQVFYR